MCTNVKHHFESLLNLDNIILGPRQFKLYQVETLMIITRLITIQLRN